MWLQGVGILTLHCVPTLPGKSRVFASLYTAAKTVPLPLRIMFRHFVCGWWEHIHGGLTILDGDAQLILGQVRPPQAHHMHHIELRVPEHVEHVERYEVHDAGAERVPQLDAETSCSLQCY